MAKVSVRIRKPAASASAQPTEEIRQVEEGTEIEINEGETAEEMDDPEPEPMIASDSREEAEGKEPDFRLAARSLPNIAPTAAPLPDDPQHVVVAPPEGIPVVHAAANEIPLHVLNAAASREPIDRRRHSVR